ALSLSASSADRVRQTSRFWIREPVTACCRQTTCLRALSIRLWYSDASSSSAPVSADAIPVELTAPFDAHALSITAAPIPRMIALSCGFMRLRPPLSLRLRETHQQHQSFLCLGLSPYGFV